VVSGFTEAQSNLSNDELWKDWNLETFAKFHKGVDKASVTQKMQQTLTEKGQLMYEVEHIKLYDLKQVYFDKNLYSRFVQGNEKNVKSMLWIGLIVLVLAIVNFYNLSTTQAITRAHEVGVKKVNGAKRLSIVKQFFSDTFLVAFIAMLLAIIIINLILPWFNDLIDAEYDFLYFKNPLSWMLLILGSLSITIISGIYPATYLSSFNPIVAIKGANVKSGSVAVFKRVLIVFQFTASILLIVGILFITKQINFLKTKDLGFNKEDVLCIYITEDIIKNKTAFVEKLTSHSSIKGVSSTHGYIGNWDHGFKLKTKCNGEDREIWSKKITIDTAFARVFDIKILQKQEVDKNKPHIMINNAALKKLEMTAPEGVELLSQDESTYLPLAGVVDDFHYMSLYNGIQPLTIYIYPDLGGIFNVRFNPNSFDSIKELVAFCETTFKEFDPNGQFNYQFLNDILAQSYSKEENYRAMVSAFSLFAVLISCLGLFGMTVFSNARRKREIGVRKILGSGVYRIIGLLLKDYLKWVGVAFVIATPIAYIVVSNWLEEFPFKTEMSWWVFVIGGIIALSIAVITIYWQTYRTATRNPVESLRDE
jgi:putative ABC transport system permease protein